jgi:ketosteroid isomerase-like protein
MKRIVLAVCVVFLVSAVAIIAQTLGQPKSEHTEQELITLENGWNDAIVKHDWAFIDRILADDYVGTTFDGIVKTKAQSLASLKSDETVITSEVADDYRVRFYGDTAVVTFRISEKSQLKGKDTSVQERVTDIWVKIAGRWQCVAEHASRIAQK